MSLFKLEWGYLTPEAQKLTLSLMANNGIRNQELAMEIAIISLGEEAAFSLPEDDGGGSDDVS